MIKFRNSENMKMLTLRRDNQKQISRLNHIIDVEQIKQEKTIVEEETAKLLKETAALQIQTCQLIKANQIKTLAEIDAKS